MEQYPLQHKEVINTYFPMINQFRKYCFIGHLSTKWHNYRDCVCYIEKKKPFNYC